MLTLSYLSLKYSRFWCWWVAWDAYFKDFEVYFCIKHQVFWYHQIIPSWYSPVTVLYSNVLAWDLANLPPSSSVKRYIQTFKDGLKISPAEVLWWASKGCSFCSQTAMLWKCLCTEHNISIPSSSKSSSFKTTSHNQIRFTFEPRCMKHHGWIFPIRRASMPIFNQKQGSFSVSVEIYYPTTLIQHIYSTLICLNHATSPQNISFLSQIGIPKFVLKFIAKEMQNSADRWVNNSKRC